jgi:hypothetical protein
MSYTREEMELDDALDREGVTYDAFYDSIEMIIAAIPRDKYESIVRVHVANRMWRKFVGQDKELTRSLIETAKETGATSLTDGWL